MQCNCKAGLGERCKHVVRVLLHFHAIDFTCMQVIPFTETKCLWNVPQAKALENYATAPLRNHGCFTNAFNKEYATKITEEDEECIKNLLYNASLDSAFSKHMFGRHEPIIPDVENSNLVSYSPELEALLRNMSSERMKKLASMKLKEKSKACCFSILSRLTADTRSTRTETQGNFKRWLQERQFRLTRSRCYGIYTYTNNKNPYWKSKSENYFYAKFFKAFPAMKH